LARELKVVSQVGGAMMPSTSIATGRGARGAHNWMPPQIE